MFTDGGQTFAASSIVSVTFIASRSGGAASLSESAALNAGLFSSASALSIAGAVGYATSISTGSGPISLELTVSLDGTLVSGDQGLSVSSRSEELLLVTPTLSTASCLYEYDANVTAGKISLNLNGEMAVSLSLDSVKHTLTAHDEASSVVTLIEGPNEFVWSNSLDNTTISKFPPHQGNSLSHCGSVSSSDGNALSGNKIRDLLLGGRSEDALLQGQGTDMLVGGWGAGPASASEGAPIFSSFNLGAAEPAGPGRMSPVSGW